MFSPVEIRNPASSFSTSRSTSKAKTSGKESNSNSKKSKKKASVGAGGIEEVAGSLVSGSFVSGDQDPAAESGPTTRSKATGKKPAKAMQDDNDDDMYATEEEDDAEESRDDGTLEETIGDEEYVGEGATGFDVDLPPRKKRKSSRNDKDGKEESVFQPLEDPTTTSTMVVQPDVSQGQHQQGPPPAASSVLMAIDPALEAFHVPSNQPTPQASGSGADIR